MTRYDFLKSMRFTGAALTGCVHESDSVVDALVILPTSSTPISATTPTSTTATSSTVTSGTTATGSTTNLSTIKNRSLTTDLSPPRQGGLGGVKPSKFSTYSFSAYEQVYYIRSTGMVADNITFLARIK